MRSSSLPLSSALWQADAERAVHLLMHLSLECNYDVRTLALKLGITPRHLQRQFARLLGRSPRDWLQQQRLATARAMLATANSVKEVALTLHFRSSAQFSRDFRNRFGCTPSSLLGSRQRHPDGRPLARAIERHVDLGAAEVAIATCSHGAPPACPPARRAPGLRQGDVHPFREVLRGDLTRAPE
jgi:AraC-like DNA-binding protein